MSGTFRPVSLHKRLNAYNNALSLTDCDLLYCQLVIANLQKEFCLENGLYGYEIVSFFGVWDYLDIEHDIGKTSLYKFFKVIGRSFKYGLREDIKKNFELTDKGKYILSPFGVSLRSQWFASLRRVLQDKKEFYRLVYLQFTKEEIAKKRAKKRFFKLPESEQIRLMREYYSLPYNTPERKKLRNKASKDLYLKYDLSQMDILGLLKKHGQIITSVRDHPDIAPLFDPIV